jgi:putative heme-binding domain-containing protein
MAASTQDDEDVGSDAAGALLELQGKDLVIKEINGNDTGRITNLIWSLGRVGNKESIGILQNVMLSKKYDEALREAAAMSLGKSFSGEDHMLLLLSEKKVPEELVSSAVEGMKYAWRKAIYTKARTYLPGEEQTAQKIAEPTMNDLAALKGDVANGKTIFKTNCGICHQAQGEGQNFGPNLSQIGSKLARESILEAIVRPNAGISFGYETWQINMKDGSTYTGILSSRTETEIDLKMPGGASQQIKTADVKNAVKKDESMMPPMHETMSTQELADVIAYLEGLKKN